jgi:ribosomal protein S18 acetylase RimI-like enzyme
LGELRPSTPARRPETARPRAADHPAIEPPTPDETERIERHLASLPAHSGAEVADARDLGVVLVRSDGDGIGFNYGALPRWPAGGWQVALDRFADSMRARGAWPSLLVADRPDRPSGPSEALPGLGWRPVHRETVMWIGRAPVVPHLDPALRIEAVQPGAVDDHLWLEGRIFGIGERDGRRRHDRLVEALRGGSLRAFVVRAGVEPVAVARLSLGDGVGGLYGIGVAENRRRQGLGTLITTSATRAGLALGNRIVWLSVEDGNAGARQMYERLGFRPLFGWARWLSQTR